VLVVSEESRIGRESIETSWIIKQILGTGVRLFFYLEDVERRLDTAMDKILLSLRNFGAEVERKKVRQRTQNGLLVRFRAGAATGGRCYGYLDVRRDNGFSYRQIDEGQAAVVKRIFSLYVDGVGGNRIAQMLDRGGVPTPRRDARRGRNPATVMDILRNPHYIGWVAFRAAGSGDAGRDLRGAVPTRCRAPGAVRSRVAGHQRRGVGGGSGSGGAAGQYLRL
jgi:DNA invertase Pin-like site-specific DNA recombinase